MKNENIAKTLKEYRKRNHIAVNDVAVHLSEHSQKVSPKTIYGWEAGQSQPDINTLLVLCELYNITDISAAFGHSKKEDFHMTCQEQELIRRFREHPEMHGAVFKLLDM